MGSLIGEQGAGRKIVVSEREIEEGRKEGRRETERHDAVLFLAAAAVAVGALAHGMAPTRADGALRSHIRKHEQSTLSI